MKKAFIWVSGLRFVDKKNKDIDKIGRDSSVGRVPARQSGGRRFKCCSSKFFFVHQNLSKNVPSQFPLWFIA